ncbi:ATP-grasp ribosomal peptide maturase [Nocardiopsis alba]|uniref:ATP-grasp ribosomal peptide maturase n=1 Tax=Nocardiopsis alba TaxID=53437 RepID=UPI003651868A
MTVLVLTQRFDPTADLVIRELHRREVPVFRCDPGDFPEQSALCAHLSSTGTVTGTLRQGVREISLTEITSIYHRRPSPHRAHHQLNESERRWSEREAAAGFHGVLSALDRFWLNHPDDNRVAAHKPRQLAQAAQAGLSVPESLITNTTHAAHTFALAQGKTVYKPMTGGPEPDGSGQVRKALYTTVVEPEEIGPGVERTAHLFQVWVDKAYEVRLTVVGEELFAARIDARGEAARTDWRSDYGSLSYAPIQTPSPVREAVLRLMCALGLTYGALDFVVTPDGEWVFLELNPNGQWGWIELATGLPIASAIATRLSKEHT